MKKALFLSLGIGFLFIATSFLLPEKNDSFWEAKASPSRVESKSNQEHVSQTVTVQLAITGDLMCHQLQIDLAKEAFSHGKQGKKGLFFDFFPQFEAIAPYLQTADCTIGNLETTISTAEKGYFGYPLFRTPAHYIEALKRAGFDILTTANNHSLDGGGFGIDYTIKVLDAYRLAHTGTYANPTQSPRALLYSVKGIRFAHVAFTYGLNGNEWKIPKEEQMWRYTLLRDKEQVKKEIEEALHEKPDFLIAHVHWGDEYQRFPNEKQRQWANFLGECGVDIIAGSHPHVVQPIEKIPVVYKGKKKEVLTLFSLGNCIAHMGHAIHAHSDYGIIWYLYFEKELASGKSSLIKSNYLPIWVHLYPKNSKEERLQQGLELLPLWQSPQWLFSKGRPLNETAQKRYVQAYQDCCAIMNKPWFTPLSPDSILPLLEAPSLQ